MRLKKVFCTTKELIEATVTRWIWKKAPALKDQSKKPRGGQPGHAGNQPKFYDLSAGDIIQEHIPTVCAICGEALTGQDEAPYRHQILELPVLRPQLTEHRLHQLNCDYCGTTTRAKLPDSVGVSRYGERLTAAVGLLSSENVQSHSKVQTLLSRFFGIESSIASVNRLRRELSNARSIPVQEAYQFVQAAPFVHSDETSFKQGNADGKNPEGRKGWLWTLVTDSVVLFEVALSRGGAIARQLIGDDYAGIVIRATTLSRDSRQGKGLSFESHFPVSSLWQIGHLVDEPFKQVRRGLTKQTFSSSGAIRTSEVKVVNRRHHA